MPVLESWMLVLPLCTALGCLFGSFTFRHFALGSSAILFAGMVPWSIACSIPLATMDVGFGAVGYGFLLWVLPLCYLVTKPWFFRREAT